MDPFEKAIRNAFEKGDPSQRAFREKVYHSAFAALERALQNNAGITPDAAARRRQLLSDRISQIESEFIPAVAAAPSVSVDPVRRPAAGEPAAPTLGGMERRGAQRPRQAADDEIEPPSYGKYAPRQRKRRPWLSLVVTVAVLAALGVGAWWMFFTPGAGPGRFIPPMESEDFSPSQPSTPPPALAGDDLGDWLVIFEPNDASTVNAPGDSRAEIAQDEDERFMRITSGSSGAPILFDVRQSVLEQIAGRRAVFNIVAKVDDGGETQMSVECSLGELGDCGRKRYAVGVNSEEFLFEIDLPQVEPGAGGTIAINPDVEGQGHAVDIIAIRVTPAG